VTVIDFGLEYMLAPAGAFVVFSRDRNEYVPGAMPVESNVTFVVVTPTLKSTNEPPGTLSCTV
jgi:hypothetical protein